MLSICAAGTPRSVCGYAFITGTISPQEEAFPSNGVFAASRWSVWLERYDNYPVRGHSRVDLAVGVNWKSPQMQFRDFFFFLGGGAGMKP